MKKIVAICLAMLFMTKAFAQSPEKMSYQAVIRDASNNLTTNQTIGMQISILQGSTNGTAVYVEIQTPTSNSNGLVSLEIGTGTTSDDFSTIDWANGPFFIKTETDPTGGSNYTITGTSQLLSVPFALHAKTADNVINGFSGDYNDLTNQPTLPIVPSIVSAFTNDAGYLSSFTESDPVFGSSVASGISGSDITNWNMDNDPTNEIQELSVSPSGDTLYLQNGGFVIIPGISAANPLPPVYCASGPTIVVDVLNPATGKIWMDRNLGATQVATSSNDFNSYGDLHQWGRRNDGHQCRASFSSTTTISSVDQPLNGDFIISTSVPYDWRNPQNPNLWQGVNGVNNPCPSGYRVPTSAELEAERLSWTTNDAAGAFGSPLKFTRAGYRSSGDATIYDVGASGRYWSSTINGVNSEYLRIFGTSAGIISTNRAYGFSVRCIKD
jgi:uncharacterized protein (TIGR02145 family)